MNLRCVRLTAAGLLVVALHGCTRGLSRAPLPLSPEPLPPPRTPGEKLAISPAETVKNARCQVAMPGGAIFLEDAAVTPSALAPGEEVHHRFVYLVCPKDKEEALAGTIIRTVKSAGKRIAQDTTEHKFKPGTWVVDASLVVPAEALPGEYHLNVTLRHGKSEVKRESTFLVRKRQ